jgi:hypothetical protein
MWPHNHVHVFLPASNATLQSCNLTLHVVCLALQCVLRTLVERINSSSRGVKMRLPGLILEGLLTAILDLTATCPCWTYHAVFVKSRATMMMTYVPPAARREMARYMAFGSRRPRSLCLSSPCITLIMGKRSTSCYAEEYLYPFSGMWSHC